MYACVQELLICCHPLLTRGRSSLTRCLVFKQRLSLDQSVDGLISPPSYLWHTYLHSRELVHSNESPEALVHMCTHILGKILDLLR